MSPPDSEEIMPTRFRLQKLDGEGRICEMDFAPDATLEIGREGLLSHWTRAKIALYRRIVSCRQHEHGIVSVLNFNRNEHPAGGRDLRRRFLTPCQQAQEVGLRLRIANPFILLVLGASILENFRGTGVEEPLTNIVGVLILVGLLVAAFSIYQLKVLDVQIGFQVVDGSESIEGQILDSMRPGFRKFP